jgi:hypothetical protein
MQVFCKQFPCRTLATVVIGLGFPILIAIPPVGAKKND